MNSNIGKFVYRKIGIVSTPIIVFISIYSASLVDNYIGKEHGNIFGVITMLLLIVTYQSLPSIKYITCKIFLIIYIFLNITIPFIPFNMPKIPEIAILMPAFFADYAIFAFGMGYVVTKYEK